MWTRFMDMHSGGGTKVKPYEYIYIEAPKSEAEIIFQNRFGRNPHRVTCTCCGEDYSLSEEGSLEQATAYERGCDYGYFRGDVEISKDEGWIPGKGSPEGVEGRYVERKGSGAWRDYQTLEDYLRSKDVLVIRASEIKPKERTGSLRSEGYVWAE